ncbi:unnamed protein product, partial [Closterium sp. Naga37s-1]
WRQMFWIGVVPAAALAAGMLWAPESPRWLAKGDGDELMGWADMCAMAWVPESIRWFSKVRRWVHGMAWGGCAGGMGGSTAFEAPQKWGGCAGGMGGSTAFDAPQKWGGCAGGMGGSTAAMRWASESPDVPSAEFLHSFLSFPLSRPYSPFLHPFGTLPLPIALPPAGFPHQVGRIDKAESQLKRLLGPSQAAAAAVETLLLVPFSLP